MDVSEKEKVFAMFAQGRSVNQVAKDLFNGSWGTANKLLIEWTALGNTYAPARVTRSGRPAKKKPKKRVARAAAPLEEADAEAEPESYDLPIRVEAVRLDAIFSGFTVGEKAEAVRFVIQERKNAILAEV
jgi:hypothetical protein